MHKPAEQILTDFLQDFESVNEVILAAMLAQINKAIEWNNKGNVEMTLHYLEQIKSTLEHAVTL
jgi:hypothetical protein